MLRFLLDRDLWYLHAALSMTSCRAFIIPVVARLRKRAARAGGGGGTSQISRTPANHVCHRQAGSVARARLPKTLLVFERLHKKSVPKSWLATDRKQARTAESFLRAEKNHKSGTGNKRRRYASSVTCQSRRFWTAQQHNEPDLLQSGTRSIASGDESPLERNWA